MDTAYGKPGLCCSRRLELAMLVLLGVMLMYSFRVTMSVSIVCMTTAEDVQITNDGNQGNVSSSNLTKENSTTLRAEFDWDKPTQGVILASFFWAYFTTPVLGGWLAQTAGGKKLFGLSVLLCSLLSLLTPIAADTHVIFLITVRALSGLVQGVMWPAQQMIWAKWAPPLERTILSGFTVSGMGLANVLAFPVCGLLCTYGPGSGWPSIFYVFGGAGVAWCGVWLLLVSDSPKDHPRISEEEKQYILTSLTNEKGVASTPNRTPWVKIIKSLPVWAIAITIATADWGLYTFLTNIPAYLNEIFDYNIVEGGLLSAMPFLGLYCISMVAIPIADYLRSKHLMSTTNVRKLFNCLGTFLPAAFLLATSRVTENPSLALGMLTLGLSAAGFVMGAVSSSNALDIASQYSGIIMGMATSFSTISGIVAPIIIGVITTDKTKEQWQVVFYIVSGIYIFGGVFYLVFGSGETQEWATEEMGVSHTDDGSALDGDISVKHSNTETESSNTTRV